MHIATLVLIDGLIGEYRKTQEQVIGRYFFLPTVIRTWFDVTWSAARMIVVLHGWLGMIALYFFLRFPFATTLSKHIQTEAGK